QQQPVDQMANMISINPAVCSLTEEGGTEPLTVINHTGHRLVIKVFFSAPIIFSIGEKEKFFFLKPNGVFVINVTRKPQKKEGTSYDMYLVYGVDTK
ncbi:hypothetical protein PMAYCL1PPCAC_02730, partial [Pristionchus mayeri]